MLAKGEVEEIIARPDVGLVTIQLYDGAIIKGRKVGFDKITYYLFTRLYYISLNI